MVLLLPCAGGCAANYRKYSLIEGLHVYEYPGHWTRYEEPLINNPNDLILTLYTEIIEGKYGDEVDLFGHSMGGLLAWQLANKLLKAGFQVNNLYIAACCDPLVNPVFVQKIKTDSDIKNILKELRQVPERVLKSDFFNNDLLPAIRNDFFIVKSILETTQTLDVETLPVNITCLYGVDDPIIKEEDMIGWNRYTSSKYRIITFSGDHFFLYKENNVAQIISLFNEK